MDFVAVIVAKDEKLREASVNALRAHLPQAQDIDWLAPHRACEIAFTPKTALRLDARHELASLLQEKLSLPADIGIFLKENRRKKLLLADMDSTMIGEESLDELAREIGVHDTVAAITGRAMRGEIDFETALRERVALLKGLPLTRVRNVIEKITFTPGAKTLAASMKAQGAYTVLVSGGFTLFTEHVAACLGFDSHIANRLECEGERLSGTVTEPILGGAAKQQALLDVCKQKGLAPDDALAIGDGANDLMMVESAGLGLGFHPKPVLAEAADAQIRHTDLASALYFQGYRRDEFIFSE